jgi:NADPH-dependent curcumin reductase CurA
MARTNKQIVLARRPRGKPTPDDFRLQESLLREPVDGELLVKNLYLSMDAGFLHWMNEGSSDEYLSEMVIDAPVMGLTLGSVVESCRADFNSGDIVMGRLTWEEFSIIDASDFLTRLPSDFDFPLNYYLGVLGGTGMTAYFGMIDIGIPKAGETVLVSAAAGAVGNVVGQIAKIFGAHTIGMSSSKDKCRQLVDELGFDQAINYRSGASLETTIAETIPGGIDIYFDNVGGETLNTVMHHLKIGARIILCGSVSSYSSQSPPPGPDNMFELVTKRVAMKGFMYTDHMDRYPEAMTGLTTWLNEGRLKNVEYVLEGIENAGVAFCHMFEGKNFGKTLVKL